MTRFPRKCAIKPSGGGALFWSPISLENSFQSRLDGDRRFAIIGPKRSEKRQRGTGQIREKVKEDENGIGIADAGSLSSEPREEAGGSKQ